MNEEISLMSFRAICSFVADLTEVFGNRHKPLKLYNRLVSQTKITHDQAIRKHIAIFKDFCVQNREGILSRDHTKIVNGKLSYSDRVYIDLAYIFRISDEETRAVIWRHILTISAFVDPDAKSKDILKKAEEGSEKEFLSSVISKVEQSVTPSSNPMEAVSSIMQSGVFTDLMGNMQSGLASGQLDMGKLLGTLQGMISTISTEAKDDPEAQQALGMINNLMGGMSAENPPDLMKLMSGMVKNLDQGNVKK
jgi:hypothetical protein